MISDGEVENVSHVDIDGCVVKERGMVRREGGSRRTPQRDIEALNAQFKGCVAGDEVLRVC